MQSYLLSFLVLAVSSLAASVPLSRGKLNSASSPRLFDRSYTNEIYISPDEEEKRQADLQEELRRIIQEQLDAAQAEAEAEAARAAQEAREAARSSSQPPS